MSTGSEKKNGVGVSTETKWENFKATHMFNDEAI